MGSRFAVRGSELLVSAPLAPSGTAGADFSVAGGSGPGVSKPGNSNPGSSVPKTGLDSSTAPLPAPEDSFMLPGGDTVMRFSLDIQAPEGWQWLPMRSAIRELPEQAWTPAAKAMAFANWRAGTKFCGVCGSPNQDKSDELARQCTR